METFCGGFGVCTNWRTERGCPERKFEKEEILQVVRDMEEDRAPGLDSFSMAFVHHC